MNKKLVSKLAFATILSLGTLAITSCSQDKNQVGQEIPNGISKVSIKVAGVSDVEDLITKSSKSKAQDIKLVEGNGFDAILAVDNNVPQIETNIAGLGSKGLRAATPGSTGMADSVKYRVFFYKNVAGTYTYETSSEQVSGSETDIELPYGDYKWVALSYNNNQSIPNRGTTDVFELEDNKDALYAQGTLTINSPNIPFNLTFNPLYSRIAIELNTMGMFGTLESASVAVTGLSSATATAVNLLDGSLTAGTTTPLAPVFSDFVAVDGNNAQKIAYVYTASNAPQDLKIILKDLKIKLDNNTERSFGSTEVTLDKSDFIPELGKSHRFLLSVAESAILYNGVKWARSNLYYRTGGTLNATPYRFYHTNPFSPEKTESFFSFKGHLPGRLASGDPSLQKDPCTLVYPAGLWKSPTLVDLKSMTSEEGVLADLVGVLLGNPKTKNTTYGDNYIEYTLTQGSANSPYASTPAANILRFNYNGMHSAIQVASGLIDIQLGNIGVQSSVWTRDNVLDGGLLALLGTTVGSWNYLARTQDPLIGGKRSVASRAAELLNIDLLNLNLTGSGFMNVRCVRNSTWNGNAPGYNPMPDISNL